MPKASARPTTKSRRKAPARLSPAEQARIAEIFHRFESLESDPRTELDYKDAYTLVVAVALSAQATDVSVNKATARLFEVADTPEKMLALGEEGLKPFISSIGLYNTKAKNVIRMAQILVDDYGGQVPTEREKLQALPGVGRKTASVVLNELRIEPAIAVDTHVFRVSHRLGLSTGKTPDAVELELMGKIPEPLLTRAHHWLILHGRYTCVARRPKCEDCPVADLCPSRHLFVWD
jgi:endonuclease-3